MRNLNKIKDKHNVSLDNRQFASLIGGTLFLGVVIFLAGYFIGGKKCDIAKIKCESNAENVKVIREFVTVPVKPVKPDKPNKTGTQTVKNTHTVKKVVVVAPEKQEQDVKKRSSATIARLKTGVPDQKIEKKPVQKKIVKKPVKKPVKKKVVPVSHGAAGKYVLQVLATTYQREAENLKTQLLQKGYRAFLQRTRSKGTTYYRVRIGYFKDRNEAKAFKGAFEKKLGFSKTFITTSGK